MSVCCEMCLVRTDRARGMCGVCLEGAAVFAGAADTHPLLKNRDGVCWRPCVMCQGMLGAKGTTRK